MSQDEQISIREFLEFRMGALEKKIDQNQKSNERRFSELGKAVADLAKAIVSQEAVGDLQAKIGEVDEYQERLDRRVIKLESQAGIIRWVMSGAWAVILALIIDKAKQLF